MNGWFDDREHVVHGRGSQERYWRPPGPKQCFRDAHPGPEDQVLQAERWRNAPANTSPATRQAPLCWAGFCASRYPVAFWKCFSPSEIGLLVNEWVLFEKYMQLLHNVGERKILLARKQILKDGLDQLSLHPGNVQCLITLKLSGAAVGRGERLLARMERSPVREGAGTSPAALPRFL